MRAFHEENRDLNLFDDEASVRSGGNSDASRSNGDCGAGGEAEESRKARCAAARAWSNCTNPMPFKSSSVELARKGLRSSTFPTATTRSSS